MKLNKRMLFGIISIVLAAVIAFIGIPAVSQQNNTTVHIVRVKTAIAEGSVITAEALEMAEVSAQNLPANVATDFSQVVGSYANVDLVAGDYFLPAKVSRTAFDKDPLLGMLPEEQIAVSVSVQSLAGILSNKLRADDIVSIYSRDDFGQYEIVDELRYVRIIAVTNANGINIEDAVEDESRMASTVTFLLTDRQAQKLITIEHEQPMHLALVSRGDIHRAVELLNEQQDILNGKISDMENIPPLDDVLNVIIGEYETEDIE